jgi:hypothetical protein
VISVTVDPVEEMRQLAARVPITEVTRAGNLFKTVFAEVFNRKWWGSMTKPEYVTALRRIVAVCRVRGWHTRDYLEVNMTWFAEVTTHTPSPTSFCGEKAWHRYEAFLREEGYVKDTGSGEDIDGPARAREVEARLNARRRIEEMRRMGLLPAQRRERAEQFAAAKVKEELTRIENGGVVPELNLPPWIKLTEDEKKQRHIDRFRALAEMEFHSRWNREHNEAAKQVDAVLLKEPNLGATKDE